MALRHILFIFLTLFGTLALGQTWQLKKVNFFTDNKAFVVFEYKAKIQSNISEVVFPLNEVEKSSFEVVSPAQQLISTQVVNVKVREQIPINRMQMLLRANIGELVDVEMGNGENGSFTGIIQPFPENSELLFLQTGKQLEAINIERIQSVTLSKTSAEKTNQVIDRQGVRLLFQGQPSEIILSFSAWVSDVFFEPYYRINWDTEVAMLNVALNAKIKHQLPIQKTTQVRLYPYASTAKISESIAINPVQIQSTGEHYINLKEFATAALTSAVVTGPITLNFQENSFADIVTSLTFQSDTINVYENIPGNIYHVAETFSFSTLEKNENNSFKIYLKRINRAIQVNAKLNAEAQIIKHEKQKYQKQPSLLQLKLLQNLGEFQLTFEILTDNQYILTTNEQLHKNDIKIYNRLCINKFFLLNEFETSIPINVFERK